MTKYREILRLSGLGLSQQNIADSCNVSKKTVNRVLRRAKVNITVRQSRQSGRFRASVPVAWSHSDLA